MGCTSWPYHLQGPPAGGEPLSMGVPATGTPMTPTVPMASMPAPSMPATMPPTAPTYGQPGYPPAPVAPISSVGGFPPTMPVGPVVEQPQRALGLVSFNTKWPSRGVCLPTFYLLQQRRESTC